MRKFAAVVAVGLFAAPALGQSAAPPSTAQLRAVNLTTSWTTAVPVQSHRDGIGLIQVVDADQVFVQTKSGVLVALDAATGGQQWAVQYTNPYTPLLPVAVNDRYVFAVNVIRLYCLHRYTGVVEFAYNLPLAPTAGPAADDAHVFVNTGSGRLVALEVPNPVRMPDKALTRRGVFGANGPIDPRAQNPADALAGRYPGAGRRNYFGEEQFEERKMRVDQPGAGLATLQRTPSLAAVPGVSPPYRLFDDDGKYIVKSDSLSAVSSLRQPYRLMDPTAGSSQRTPSLAAIPPSVARVFQLSNLLPRGIEPKVSWVYGSTVRLINTPLVTRQRVWTLSASPSIIALLKEDKGPQVQAVMTDAPAGPAAQAEDVGYVPLEDGNLLAIRLASGVGSTLKLAWRANVGTNMTNMPVVNKEAVLTSGVGSGVVRVDRQTGEVTWRTQPGHDYLLAVNREHAYIRDRAGKLFVYDRFRANDPVTKLALPLASVDLSSLTAGAANGQTDRVLVGADSGLLVCLRDAGANYSRPVQMAPPRYSVDAKPAPAAAGDQVPPGDTSVSPPTAGEKKEPEKKEPEKKD